MQPDSLFSCIYVYMKIFCGIFDMEQILMLRATITSFKSTQQNVCSIWETLLISVVDWIQAIIFCFLTLCFNWNLKKKHIKSTDFIILVPIPNCWDNYAYESINYRSSRYVFALAYTSIFMMLNIPDILLKNVQMVSFFGTPCFKILPALV